MEERKPWSGFSERLYVLDAKTYRHYLASSDWRARRSRWHAANPNTACFVCARSGVPLQLHHKDYKTLGRERDRDLTPLCDSCHGDVHRAISDDSVPLAVAHLELRTRREVMRDGTAPDHRRIGKKKRRRAKR